MIGVAQIGAVWDAIEALPRERRPRLVDRVFKLVLRHLDQDTGLVLLSREEFSKLLDTAPKHVSSALGELVAMGVLLRERVRVPGLRGPGVAVYRVNADVAWNGQLPERERAAKRPGPLLRIMEGSAV